MKLQTLLQNVSFNTSKKLIITRVCHRFAKKKALERLDKRYSSHAKAPSSWDAVACLEQKGNQQEAYWRFLWWGLEEGTRADTHRSSKIGARGKGRNFSSRISLEGYRCRWSSIEILRFIFFSLLPSSWKDAYPRYSGLFSGQRKTSWTTEKRRTGIMTWREKKIIPSSVSRSTHPSPYRRGQRREKNSASIFTSRQISFTRSRPL
jgi:hypothetical protein